MKKYIINVKFGFCDNQMQSLTENRAIFMSWNEERDREKNEFLMEKFVYIAKEMCEVEADKFDDKYT